jgi:hypothetical protein
MTNISPTRDASRPAGERSCGWHDDFDIRSIGAVVWITGVVRVVAALLRHEFFATEATLALAVVITLPWFFWRQLRRAQPAQGSARQFAPGGIPGPSDDFEIGN